MTTPTPEQLHHLADRARRGVALPAEHDQLAAGITAMAARIVTLEQVAESNKRHVRLIFPELERAEAAIERVRAVLGPYLVEGGMVRSADIRAALDQSQQPTA